VNDPPPSSPTPRRDLTGKKFYPPVVPDQMVGSSVPCARCGYNLKTLNTRRLCPECGKPVEASVRHYHAASDRRYPRGGPGANSHVNSYLVAAGLVFVGCLFLIGGPWPAGGRNFTPGANMIAGLALWGGAAYLILWKLFHPDG
jgi:hypothetical protein